MMEVSITPRPAPGGQGKKRRPGRPAAADPRERISLRLSGAEARALIDAAVAVGMPTTTYIRNAALGRRLIVLPQINRAAWSELGRTSGLLNQAVAMAHAGRLPGDLRPVLFDLAEQVRRLRLDLVASTGQDEEDEA
jgi:hypothetical protein